MLKWLPGSQWMISCASGDGTVRVWHTRTGQERQIYMGCVSPQALFVDDRSLLCASDSGEQWEIHDIRLEEVRTAFQEQNEQLNYCLEFSSEGVYIASGNSEGELYMCDTTTGAVYARCATRKQGEPQNPILGLAWSPDSTWVATVGPDAFIRIWTREGETLLKRFEAREDGASEIVWSPDGGMLATTGHTSTIDLWDVATGTRLQQWPLHAPEPFAYGRCLAWSPDGQWIASGHDDGHVIIWDAGAGEKILILQDHLTEDALFHVISAIAWSPDGKLLASASTGGVVRIWAIESSPVYPF